MISLRKLLASVMFSSSAAVSQAPSSGLPGPAIPALLELDAARAQRVHAILENARLRRDSAQEQIGRPVDAVTLRVLQVAMEAIAAEADRKLAIELTPGELERLRAVIPLSARTRRWINL